MSNYNELRASDVINGAFGQLKINSVTIANVMSIDYTVELDERPIKIAGTRKTGYKTVGVNGSGTLQIYRIDSEFMRHLPNFFRPSNEPAYPGLFYDKMEIKLDDPESGVGGQIDPIDSGETIALLGVKINRLTGGFNVDSIVEQTLDFTFESIGKPIDLLPEKYKISDSFPRR